MFNTVNLFYIAMAFGLVSAIAAMRSHWSEFGFFLFVAFFAIMGFVFRLLS